MTQYETCREWLESYREMHAEVRRLRAKHQALMDQAESITARLSPTPGGGGGDHEQLLAALADADAETAAALRKAEQQALQIRSFIARIPDSTSRAVLRTRYLTMLSWTEIQRELARSGMKYSKDHLYKLHKKALEEAEPRWLHLLNSPKNVNKNAKEDE